MKIFSSPYINPICRCANKTSMPKLKSQPAYDTFCFRGNIDNTESKPNFARQTVEIPERLKDYNVSGLDMACIYHPDFAKRILYDKITRPNGKVEDRFSVYNIRSLLDMYDDEPKLVEQLVAETKTNEKGEIVPRFNAPQIADIVDMYNRAPFLTKQLVSDKITDKFGNKTERFDASEISTIFNMYPRDARNLERFNQLLDEKDKNNEYIWLCDDIYELYTDPICASNREALKDKDISTDARRVLIRLNSLSKADDINNTMELIKQHTQVIEEPEEFAKIINKNHDLDIADFNKYISEIDYKKLSNIAPRVKTFNSTEMLKFLEYHYKAGENDFNTDTLKLTPDFTNFIAENFVSSNEMEDILTVFPLTERNVGEMPEVWFDNTDSNYKKENKAEVQNVIDEFVEKQDSELFEVSLSCLLNKDVSVKKIGEGAFGTAYKISLENCPDVVLKTFHNKHDNLKTVHGKTAEPQFGIFFNNNSKDYVHMFFGRVCGQKDSDGYLVTQYLDENVTPIEGKRNNPNYKITSVDAIGTHNIINGKIIDYGGTYVENPDGSEIEYSLFDIKKNKC